MFGGLGGPGGPKNPSNVGALGSRTFEEVFGVALAAKT